MRPVAMAEVPQAVLVAPVLLELEATAVTGRADLGPRTRGAASRHVQAVGAVAQAARVPGPPCSVGRRGHPTPTAYPPRSRGPNLNDVPLVHVTVATSRSQEVHFSRLSLRSRFVLGGVPSEDSPIPHSNRLPSGRNAAPAALLR
jgi:hypothetical protein